MDHSHLLLKVDYYNNKHEVKVWAFPPSLVGEHRTKLAVDVAALWKHGEVQLMTYFMRPTSIDSTIDWED